jgi:hypothetical protein
MSLGVGVPKSQGLNENQAYLPTLVQGVLVDSIRKYSAISVLDRVSLDRVIAETLDPTFEDNLDIVRLGHVAQVGNWLTGNIIRTSTGYSLQINITDTTPNATTIASYTGTCTVAEFDNYSAIHKASLALLEQMGVALTQRAKDELAQASTPQYVNVQTALSQSLIAQRNGQIIQSLAYGYEANNYDPYFSEAATWVNTLSATVRTGNLGQDIRNDIAWRNEWKKLLDDAAAFFKANEPVFAEVILRQNSLTRGKIDYDKETINFTATYEVRSLPIPSRKILDDLRAGLQATGRNGDWKLPDDLYRWNRNCVVPAWRSVTTYTTYWKRAYFITAELVNDECKTISTSDYMSAEVYEGTSITENFRKQHTSSKYSSASDDPFRGERPLIFNNVKASDITDNMTVRVKNIYEFFGRTYYDSGRFSATYDLDPYRSGPNLIPVRVE